MRVLDTYRYTEKDRVIITPEKPPEGVAYTAKSMLIPDEGKALTNGTDIVGCIEVEKGQEGKWTECPKPIEVEPLTPEEAAEEYPKVVAELTRYKAAVADATAINTSTALKADLVSAITRLKAAVEIKTEPIIKEIAK